jgi:hypothetical protein
MPSYPLVPPGSEDLLPRILQVMAAQTIAFWDFPKPIIAAVSGRGLLAQGLPPRGVPQDPWQPVADEMPWVLSR